MAIHSLKLRREDPILGLKTPLLFAHRGGAGEAPESTEEAFRHAVRCGTNVLELDVSLTADGEPVVWHGPGLEKVRGKEHTYGEDDYLGAFAWQDLRDRVWVLHPDPGDEPEFVPKPERRLLRLSEFFELVGKLEHELEMEGKPRPLPVNIELKEPKGDAPDWKGAVLDKLLDMVDGQPVRRKTILASMTNDILKELRERMVNRQKSGRGRCYPTNLSWSEQMAYSEHMKLKPALLAFAASMVDLFVGEKDSLADYAFETSHAVLSQDLVCEVRKHDGALYVFLTGISGICGLEGIDHLEPGELKEPLFEMLDRGVDGIMTDYPKKVSKLLQEWQEQTE